MARIRSIKPEFPQSETIGKLSRDARLLFILLWTIVDDGGRARAASRMLASLLYPYDDDAPGHIGGWLDELERNGCVRRYEVDGSAYLDIPNWLKHQKIDRPSASKLPAFDESSMKPREPSRALDADLGPRTLDLGEDQRSDISAQAGEREALAAAVEIYNRTAEAVGWPAVQRLTDSRKAALRKRLEECGGPDGWSDEMERASGSPFLTGDNRDGWKADFDFFLQAKSFTKLMEGGYDARTPSPRNAPAAAPGTSGPDRLIAGMARVLSRSPESRHFDPRTARASGPDAGGAQPAGIEARRDRPAASADGDRRDGSGTHGAVGLVPAAKSR